MGADDGAEVPDDAEVHESVRVIGSLRGIPERGRALSPTIGWTSLRVRSTQLTLWTVTLELYNELANIWQIQRNLQQFMQLY